MPKHVRLFFVALAYALLPGAATTALASPGHPAPPAGFRPALDPPAGAAVQSELITLPAGECASVNGDTSCQAIHLSYGVNLQALPAGSTIAGASSGVALAATVPPGYWYWSRWDKICALYGCWYFSMTLTEDGVANGNNVWKWDEGCTPGGLARTTWCGYFYNGGGPPNYAMQFGINIEACAPLSGGTVCAAHGIRRWIDDFGNPGGYSAW
jgi:hypothetical protein